MKRRTILGTVAALTLATGLAGTALAQDTLKIGAVGPKTGPLAGSAEVSY